MLPGLKATGRDVQRSLQRAAAGVSGIRFGGVSTALIAAEVALATAFLTIGGQVMPSVLQDSGEGMGIAAEEYLAANIGVVTRERVGDADLADTTAVRARYAAVEGELLRRLSAAPRVEGVALASSLPGDGQRSAVVEVEGGAGGRQRVYMAQVDVGFFRGLGRSVIQGRDFARVDVEGTHPQGGGVVIVNTSFVEDVLGGRNAVGRRIRYVTRPEADPGPWLEIVGVVGHLGMNEINPDRDAGFYVPAAPGGAQPRSRRHPP